MRAALRIGLMVLLARALVSTGPSPAPRGSVRVWRRALDGSTDSCQGRVDTIPLERYVKGVVPHEWIPSWQPEALKAGAVAARTYAAYWLQRGGKYPCADVDDTTASQVYRDETEPSTDAAVDATRGELAVDGSGSAIFAEYSAENGQPTSDGVDEPLCAGARVDGHGRGMCQWGTQRWAEEGKDYRWMIAHYYPGARLREGSVALAALKNWCPRFLGSGY